MRRRAAPLALAALGLGAGRAAVAAAPSTPTPPRPTPLRLARPTPRPTATPYPSGGLGLFRGEWEERHGRGRGAGPLFGYGGGKLGGAFANDLIWYLERSWGADQVVAVEVARDESRAYIPTDARLLRTYQTRSLRRVDLYASSSLGERFRLAAENGEPIDPWRGVEPDTFIVYYRKLGDRVTGVVLSTGNNP